jgi:hypothetical protein
MTESDAVAAIKRAGVRAVFHLLRAGVESLKAVEAIVDELASIGKESQAQEPVSGRVRIDVE